MTTGSPRVAIVGAGAWGTALAVHLAIRAAARPSVTLVVRDERQLESMRSVRSNDRYLPGVDLPPELGIAPDGPDVADHDVVIVATPAHALPEVARRLARAGARAPLVFLCKGFVAGDDGGPRLAHRAVGRWWPAPLAAVSGPSFAEEVAKGLPTALSVASTAAPLAGEIAALLRGGALRVYESDDLIGVETGGAVKNVLAIAAGASDGLGFGHNARAALITRGLAEMARLAVALGGRRETMMGLAGLGDLVLTCTGDLSRNRRVGLELAAGKPLPRILADLGHVAEGVAAAKAVVALAAAHSVSMPISEAVSRVLYEDLPVKRAVEALLAREPRPESH